MILRPYQSQAVDLIGDAFNTSRSVMFVLPTGAGKTQVFSDIARLCRDHGTRVAILVHRDTLLRQASDKLSAIGVEHSLISPGRTDFGDCIKVASIQTLARRIDRNEFDLLVIDEAHHALASSYRKLISAWPEARVLGVTATPMRLDGRGLGEVFESLILGPSIRELTDDGYLTEAISYGASHIADLGAARTTAGDYNVHDIQEIMDRKEITGDAVDHYSRICPGVPALAFCATVKHAKDVAAEFSLAGYRSSSIDGTMSVADIRGRILALSEGRIQVLASCDLISEGFDAPDVSAAILLRPTKSTALHMQQIGRILRPSYERNAPLETREQRLRAIANSHKRHAIILDHAGNSFRHGLADEPREWSLDAKKKKASTATGLKTCPNCFAHCRSWEKSCKRCGHAFIVVAIEREVEHVPGQLVVLDHAVMRAVRRREEWQAKTYPQLVDLGRRRGYKPGWAYKRWVERGGDPAAARF